MFRKEYKNIFIIIFGSIVTYFVSFYLISKNSIEYSTYIIYFGIASIAADSGYRTKNLVLSREISVKNALETRLYYIKATILISIVSIIFFNLEITRFVYVIPEIVVANVILYAYSISLSSSGNIAASIRIDFLSKLLSSVLRVTVIYIITRNGLSIDKNSFLVTSLSIIAIIYVIFPLGLIGINSYREFINKYFFASAIFMLNFWLMFESIKNKYGATELLYFAYCVTILSIFYTYFPVILRYKKTINLRISVTKINIIIIALLILASVISEIHNKLNIIYWILLLNFFALRVMSVVMEYRLIKENQFNAILYSKILLFLSIAFLNFVNIEAAIIYWLILEYAFAAGYLFKIKK